MLQLGRRGVVRQPMFGISPDCYMVTKNSHRFTIDCSHLCPCFTLSFSPRQRRLPVSGCRRRMTLAAPGPVREQIFTVSKEFEIWNLNFRA